MADAIHGNQELFAREEAVEACWRIVDPVLGDATPLHPYEPGGWGPREAEALIGKQGPWRNPAAGLS